MMEQNQNYTTNSSQPTPCQFDWCGLGRESNWLGRQSNFVPRLLTSRQVVVLGDQITLHGYCTYFLKLMKRNIDLDDNP